MKVKKLHAIIIHRKKKFWKESWLIKVTPPIKVTPFHGKVSTLLQNWKLRSRIQLAKCTKSKTFNRNHHQQSYPIDQSSPILLYFFTPSLEFLGILLKGAMAYLVKVLDSQSRGHVIKTIGWLQDWLNLSSFWGQYIEYQEFLGT